MLTAMSSSAERRGLLLDSLELLDAVGRAEINLTVPPRAPRLTVCVFDPDGSSTCVLLDETRPVAGRRTVTWRGMDDAGRVLPN